MTQSRRLRYLATVVVLAIVGAGCGQRMGLVTITAAHGGEPPPFRDGSHQTFEVLAMSGERLTTGEITRDGVTISLEPGTYRFVSWTRSDASMQFGPREPTGGDKGGTESRSGVFVEGAMGPDVARCELAIVLTEHGLSIAIEATRPRCQMKITGA